MIIGGAAGILQDVALGDSISVNGNEKLSLLFFLKFYFLFFDSLSEIYQYSIYGSSTDKSVFINSIHIYYI